MTETRPDLTRTTLAIFCIIGLIGLSVWVLRPFLAATVWATMIVVATWPLLKMLEARFGNRRAPAVTVMTVGMLLLLVLPLWLAIDTISEHSDQLTAAGHHIAENGLPKPPNWVATLPLVGERIATLWTQLAASGAAGIFAKITPYAADTGKWVLSQVGGLGGMLIQFLLVVMSPPFSMLRVKLQPGWCSVLAVAWPASVVKIRSSWPGRPFVAWRSGWA
jgi:predicted PurR-regulated permease PerM